MCRDNLTSPVRLQRVTYQLYGIMSCVNKKHCPTATWVRSINIAVIQSVARRWAGSKSYFITAWTPQSRNWSTNRKTPVEMVRKTGAGTEQISWWYRQTYLNIFVVGSIGRHFSLCKSHTAWLPGSITEFDKIIYNSMMTAEPIKTVTSLFSFFNVRQ